MQSQLGTYQAKGRDLYKQVELFLGGDADDNLAEQQTGKGTHKKGQGSTVD